jgi:outer membrane immunogenic protein
MKKLLLAGVAIGALLAHDAASAKPKKPPIAAPPPAPVFSWTGCYAGANVGWGWGRNDITQTTTVSSLTSGTVFSSKATTGVDTDGAVFGGQVGCDWQFHPNFLIGVQGMFDGAAINGRANDAMSLALGAPGNIGVKTKWLGSVTGRLGWVFTPDAVVYFKGGGAWAGYRVDANNLASNVGGFGVIPGTLNTDFNGGTIGGGGEWRFWQNWTAFVEYNYYWFGSKTIFSGTTAFTGSSSVCGGTCTATNTLSLKPTIQTVTVGVNLRFWSP